MLILKNIFALFFQALVVSQVMAEEVDLAEIDVVDHLHDENLVEFLPSEKKIHGKELLRKRQSTLGDTLQNEVGISSTSFGPNASRPVIRGLDGPRIKILQNGLSTLDASTQSVDHAVPVDVLLIDHLEIARGPMALLYGSSATGGVVNIVTNRIHSSFGAGLATEFQSQAETVNHGLSHSARMDYGKNQWMLHLDGSTKNLQDQRIPGYSKKNGPKEDKGVLPNSEGLQQSLGTGLTRFFERGHLGLSFGHLGNDYGTVVEENVTIQMLQNRFELNGEYRPEGHLFKKYLIKSAQSQYQHKEKEGDVTGTVFRNIGNETRLEAINESGSVKGISGIQTQLYDFSAKGEEAFMPGTNNNVLAAFSFQEYSFAKNSLSASTRWEDTRIAKSSSATFPGSDTFRFFALNGSGGYQYHLTGEKSLGVHYSYTERAPTFQELLSNGPHLATGTFDVGDGHLKKEKSHSFELFFKHLNRTSQLNLNFYTQLFNEYITLNPTGTVNDGLPVYQYEQVNAMMYGAELDGKNKLFSFKQGDVNLTSRMDFIRGKNTDSGKNLPRLSPARVGLGMEYVKDHWNSDIDVQYVTYQSHTAPNETNTKDYALTNLGVQYSFLTNQSNTEVFFRVRNIFDVEARSHVSTLKDIAPLPGRNIVLGARLLL